MVKFEKVRVITLNIGSFRRGAALALPGIGIFVGRLYARDKDLLRHEFGHVLQARKWGYVFFYFRVAWSSLMSAYKNGRRHQHHWTEWSANHLSYHYFGEPVDWNTQHYPVTASSGIKVLSYPQFCPDPGAFYDKYLSLSHSRPGAGS